MDFEDFGNLSIKQINEISKVFLDTLEKETGISALIYSNSYSAKNIFSSELSKYPLWVAHYNVNRPSSNGKWQTLVGWQYTSTGQISGISGYVDRNKFTSGVFLGQVKPLPNPDDFENLYDNNIIYTVKKGDTLSKIAKQYNTTVNKLVKDNKIKNPNLIYINQIIKINSSSEIINGDNSCGKILYKIKSGDTLSSLAIRYNSSIEAIAKINNISNPNLIYAGTTIRIPTCTMDLRSLP